MSLPDLLAIEEVQARLNQVFPDGVPNRTYLTRRMAASVVFAMLYCGAIEDEGTWLGPKHVYCMSDAQSERTSEAERKAFAANAWKPGYSPIGQQWYADTTRESLRDETLREGLVRVGAAVQRSDVATNSSYPRYALQRDFAALFTQSLVGDQLAVAMTAWAEKHLNRLALARMAVMRRDAKHMTDRVQVALPSGSTRQLAPGPSSVILKAVVEEFAPRYLYEPVVILLSEGANKIVVQESELVKAIGLDLRPERLLPDVVLFDVRPGKEMLLFVEVVATDGPISDSRKAGLLEIANQADIPSTQIAFVTAYQDRNSAAFKKTFETLAWNTLAWFASEPDHIVVLRDQPLLENGRIFDLLR